LLGLRHATDADHVVAVTTIVARERRLWASSLIGAWWGIGHSLTIFFVGGSILVFSVVIPPRVGLAMELVVAAMLIALGTARLSGRLGGSGRPQKASGVGVTARLAARPVVVGIVHGLAGSAAVALLVLSTIHSARWGLLYLLIFALGTVAGMMLLTTAIALPFAYTARRFDRLNGWLGTATGLASIAFGVFVAYQLGVHGVLSPAPHWTPK
jgi:high-affinity nickel-transport protein